MNVVSVIVGSGRALESASRVGRRTCFPGSVCLSAVGDVLGSARGNRMVF